MSDEISERQVSIAGLKCSLSHTISQFKACFRGSSLAAASIGVSGDKNCEVQQAYQALLVKGCTQNP